ncbi:MAG: peptidoglycan-binding domain-containing protein [Candidatus Brennerbacteria bacterium]
MSKSFKKIASIGLSVSTAVYLFGAAAIPASAQSTADLAAQIAVLLAQIQTLQAQLAAQSGGTPAASSYSFTRSLTVGSTGADVKALQQWLNAKGYTVSASGAGSVGSETQTFGPATRAALARYQAAVGISPAAGYFGPVTRARVSAAGGVTGGTTPPVVSVPTGTDLVVSVASDSPISRTIGSGTAFNAASKFALTAGSKSVSVSSVTFQKGGFLANTNLNGIDAVDSKGVRHGQVVTSVNADNTITIVMTADPIVVPAGSTEYITVRFNLLSGNYTGTVSFGINAVSAIAANTSAISGAFPLAGAAMNIVNGGTSLASTTLDVLTSTGSSTLNVDANSSQEITKFRIQETGSQEGAYLHRLTLYNYGNANEADFRDVTLLDQADVVLATAQPSGQYVTFNLASPYFIDKGLTKDFTVKAKLVGGTTKTIRFVVFNNYDIDLRGATTGVSVIPGAGTNDATFPLGNAYNQTTIGSGTITLTRASDSPSSAIVPGASSVVLAKFNAKPNGENYELRQVSFGITNLGIPLTGTVYVKVNGQIVYSAGASGASSTSAVTFSLSAYPILTAGVDNSIVIEVSAIPSNATAASSYTVLDFNLEQVKRVVSNDILSSGDTGLTTGDTDALTISVQAATLVVTTLATPVAGKVVAGTVGYEYATFQLNAQTGGEDVKVSRIIVSHSGGTASEVANLLMYKDSSTSPIATTASTAANGTTVTFNFSQPIVVARGTPVVLHLKADAVSGTGAHTFSIASSTTPVSATGALTGNSLAHGSNITFAGGGQVQTHAAVGELNISLDGASPSSNQVVAANTNGITVLAFKLTSLYEAQKVTSLKLTATSSGSLDSTQLAIATTTLKNIRVYEGNASTPFASAPQFDGCFMTPAASSSYCTVTFTASDNLLSAPVPSTGVTIYVKADVASLSEGVRLGNSFKFNIASSTSDISIKGAVTGLTTGIKTGAPTAGGLTYVVPQKVTIEAVSPTAATTLGTGSGQIVGIFKVTNNGSASIRLASTTAFKFTEGGSSTSTFKLYASGQNGSSGDTTYDLTPGYSSGTSTQGGVVNFNVSTSTDANRTIDGGYFRYLTIKNGEATTGGSTYRFSVSTIGNLTFNVDEAQFGVTTNDDTDLSDTVSGLYLDGLPALGTVTISSSL